MSNEETPIFDELVRRFMDLQDGTVVEREAPPTTTASATRETVAPAGEH